MVLPKQRAAGRPSDRLLARDSRQIIARPKTLGTSTRPVALLRFIVATTTAWQASRQDCNWNRRVEFDSCCTVYEYMLCTMWMITPHILGRAEKARCHGPAIRKIARTKHQHNDASSKVVSPQTREYVGFAVLRGNTHSKAPREEEGKKLIGRTWQGRAASRDSPWAPPCNIACPRPPYLGNYMSRASIHRPHLQRVSG